MNAFYLACSKVLRSISRSSKQLLVAVLCLQLGFVNPQWAFAGQANQPFETLEEMMAGVDQKQVAKDIELAYWAQLDQNFPWLTEFALGDPITPHDQPLWTFQSNDPLLDLDPFFLRSQTWGPLQSACEDLCGTYNDQGHVVLEVPHAGMELTLRGKFKILGDTDHYIFIGSLDDEIFRAKVPGSDEPAEGIFFLNKMDLRGHASKSNPVPIFYFPLPGDGWVGDEITATDLSGLSQVLIKSADGFVLPIEMDDVLLIENTSRRNLISTQMQTLLAHQLEPSGIALPMPGSTAAFGLMPTGLSLTSGRVNGATGRVEKIIEHLKQLRDLELLPQAHASEPSPSTTRLNQMRDLLDRRLLEMERVGDTYVLAEQNGTAPAQGFLARAIPERVRAWFTPVVLYGGTAGVAYSMAQQIEIGELIAGDASRRLLILAGLFGATAAASVALRYTAFRDHFNKVYPPEEADGILARIHREHKAFLDTNTHSLYLAETAPGQMMRQYLEYLKDRYFSRNQLINRAWDQTMGFQIRQSSGLPVDWKTFYLGSIVHGMSDSTLVAVHLLIVTPWAMQFFGFGSELGTVAAAFATSEVIRNFIGYLQGGAHGYASDVKFIHLNRAEKEANRILRSQGKDPTAPTHSEEKNKLIQEYLERIYVSLGLPTSEKFMFDSVSVIQSAAKASGFGLEALSDLPAQDQQFLAQQHFHLSQRHWGKIVPALKMALDAAKTAYDQAPSQEGLKVIETLEWALSHHSFFTGASLGDSAMKLTGLVGSADFRESLGSFVQGARSERQATLSQQAEQGRARLNASSFEEHVASAVRERIDRHERLGFWGEFKATMVGTYRYLRQGEVKNTRDIRLVAFLMSTSGSVADVINYLPKSWLEKAGSRAAAGAAAELFHRAFSSLHHGKGQSIQPEAELEAQYGARASSVVAQMNDPNLADPFIYRVRYWEVLRSIADHDRQRFEIMNYEPPAMGALERRQWERARRQAAPILEQMQFDQAIGRKWQAMGESFAEFVRQTESQGELNQSEWIRQSRRRMVLVSEFARNMGLYLADVETSQILDTVIGKAERDLYRELEQPEIRSYLNRISAEEAEFYEARLFYNHFISHYVHETADAHKLSADSPEFPGRFQGVRIRLAGKKWAKTPLFFVKTLESAFKNSAESYQAGLMAAITRNVPFVSDLYGNFMNSLKIMPYALSFGYLTYYYIWQVHMPYNMFLFMLMFMFTHPVLVEWNNRLMRFFDIKPMEGVPEKLTYSFIHSNLTNPIVMFQLAFSGAIAGILTESNMALGLGAAGAAYGAKLLWDQRNERKQEQKFREETEVVNGQLVRRRPSEETMGVIGDPQSPTSLEPTGLSRGSSTQSLEKDCRYYL